MAVSAELRVAVARLRLISPHSLSMNRRHQAHKDRACLNADKGGLHRAMLPGDAHLEAVLSNLQIRQLCQHGAHQLRQLVAEARRRELEALRRAVQRILQACDSSRRGLLAAAPAA